MKNKIYINSLLVVNCITFKNAGHIRHKLILENKEEIILCKGKKIICNIQCCECQEKTELIFKLQLLNRQYLCKSCRNKGFRNGFYGKHHKQDSKNLMSKYRIGRSSPMKGKKLQDFLSEDQIIQWRLKLSKANSGEKNPMYGKNWQDFSTPEKIKLHREHIRLSMTGEKNPMYGERLVDHMSMDQYQQWLEHFSKTLETHTSKPEQIVADWLMKNNIKYKHSFFLFNEETKYSHQYDFYIYNTSFLIEVQGDYWHGNPKFYNKNGDDNHKKLNESQIKKIKTDLLKNKLAKKYGYSILYIWEDDIINNRFDNLQQLII